MKKRGEEKNKKKKRKGMELGFRMEYYDLYGFIWDWYGFLGLSYEFFLTLDVLKVGLVKP